MKIVRCKKWYAISLFGSFVYFLGFFILPLVHGIYNISVFFTCLLVPLLVLYIAGLVFITLDDYKKDLGGWGIVFYMFIYLLGSLLYLSDGVSAPSNSMQNGQPYLIDLPAILFLNLIAIWYAFGVPLLLKCGNKKHCYGLLATIFILVIVTILIL